MLNIKKMDFKLGRLLQIYPTDLRTPLTSIIGYIQLLEDNSLSENEKKISIINIIKRDQNPYKF